MNGCTDFCQRLKWRGGGEVGTFNNKHSKLESVINSTYVVPPPKPVVLKVDSGASSHYIQPEDATIFHDMRPHSRPAVLLPDSTTLAPTHQGMLRVSEKLSKSAQIATVLPKL